jgi:two-component system, NarL family, response regulator DevR
VNRLLLVDDHEIVRRGLRDFLEAHEDFSVVAEAGSVAEAEGLDPHDFDLAVLDVRLPDGSGIDLCRHYHDQRPELPCVMLTSFADDEALAASVLADARGYVLKTVRGDDLVGSLRRVLEGEQLLKKEQVERARANLRRQATEEARLASLSTQERRILGLLAEGMSNREIAETMFLAEKTIKNYVSNLLAKLGFSRRTEAALFARSQQERHHPGAS